MSDIIVQDPQTGEDLIFEITGERPTAQEAAAINRALQRNQVQTTFAPPPERSFLSKATVPVNINQLQPAFVGAGATLGGAAGSPLGPVGIGGGGILGAALGQGAFEATALAGEKLGLVGPGAPLAGSAPRGGPIGATNRAAREMAFESVGMGIATGARPLVRGALRGIARIGSRGERVASQAQSLGVGLGVEDVTERTSIRGFRKVLGRFPIIGGPFKTADLRKARQIGEALDSKLIRLGPSVTEAELGTNLKSAAGRKFKFLKGEISNLYDEAFDAARQSGATIPLDNTKAAAEELVSEATMRRPMIRLDDGRLVAMPKPVRSKMLEFAKNLNRLEDHVTVDQYDELTKDLADLMDLSRKQGLPFKRGFEIKKALEADLKEITDASVAGSLRQADRRWGALMRLADRPTGQRFRRVEKNIFGPGFEDPGTAEADQLFGLVFNSKSPRAISDLRHLVGDRTFQVALRRHIENAVDASSVASKDGIFLNVKTLRNMLGLGKTQKSQRAALSVALRGTGVSIDEIDALVDVVDAASRNGVIDVSQFIARRATLGGFRAVTRALLPGASFTGGAAAAATGHVGVASGIATVYGLRKLGQVITSPRLLRSLTTALQPNLTAQQRNAALLRFTQLGTRAFGREFEKDMNEALRSEFGSVFDEGGEGRNR